MNNQHNPMNQQLNTQPTQHGSQTVERTRRARVTVPATDIYETEDAVILLTEMPGVSENDVSITLEKDVLTIEGNQRDSMRPGYSLSYSEYDTTDYRRVFTLSTDVKREGIEAAVKDGVLKLILPKAEPAKARRISVRAG